MQAASWSELLGWNTDRQSQAFQAFHKSCPALRKRDGLIWEEVCAFADVLAKGQPGEQQARRFFTTHFQPWRLVKPDGELQGLVTGYYEPLLKGSRRQHGPYVQPMFGPPADMVSVALEEVYPDLKHKRLRGRLSGQRLIPYYTRGQWLEQDRKEQALLWVDSPIEGFFLEIQGSGLVELEDGSRVRLSYADQNGHPYRSIGRWLIREGELKPERVSMQGIKRWAQQNPQRLKELLSANPSMVFFREVQAVGSGPPGALGIPLTPRRSIAVDLRHLPLGAPVWLDTTWPNTRKPLRRLMVAQDTGGAIRGVVRADFYWGSGDQAGQYAGQMKQQGKMWLLMPKSYQPPLQ